MTGNDPIIGCFSAGGPKFFWQSPATVAAQHEAILRLRLRTVKKFPVAVATFLHECWPKPPMKITILRTPYQIRTECAKVEKRQRACINVAIAAAILSMLCILCLTGCTQGPGPNPWLTPAAITGDVSDAVQIGLIIYPKSAEEVALAREIICKESGNTNATTATVLASLEKAGITNTNSKLIISGVLLIWHRVEPYAGTNAQVYAEAVCLGMRQGTGVGLSSAEKSAKRLPPFLR